jgi:hypothetical protein
VTDIAAERGRLALQGLDIIYREQWGAVQEYTSARTVNRPARWLFLHISVTIDHGDLSGDEHRDLRTIERIGQERFSIGFPYNAAVFDTGRLYEGQPLTRRGAHTVNVKDDPRFRAPDGRILSSLNYDARALVLPQMVTDDVTDAQIDQAARWGAALRRSGEAMPGALWYGHRDVAFKDCPGQAAYNRLAELNDLTDHYERAGLGSPEEGEEDDEMKDYLVRSDDGSRLYVVARDLSSKTYVVGPSQLTALRATGQYLSLDLNDAQLARIPEVAPTGGIA